MGKIIEFPMNDLMEDWILCEQYRLYYKDENYWVTVKDLDDCD